MKRIIVFLAFLATLGATAGAQQTIDPFVWINTVGSVSPLFPEIDISSDPAVLANLTRPLIFPFGTYLSNSSTDTTTIPEGEPQAGGTTRTVGGSLMIGPLGTNIYLPLSNDLVAGGQAYGSFSNLGWSKTTDTNYSVADQTITTTYDNLSYRGSVTADAAMPVGIVMAGAEGFYGLFHDPVKEEFTMVKDPTANDTTAYTAADGTTYYETMQMQFGGTLGATYTADALTVGTGLAYAQENNDQSVGWTAADVNQNGTAEQIVSARTYQTDTTYGNGLAAYSYLDLSTTRSLVLHPFATYALSDTISLVGSGYWSILNSIRYENYERTVANSQALATRTYDAGLTDGNLTLGAEWQPIAPLRVRGGLGYTIISTRRSQTSVDDAGGSTYDLNNTNHYDERNLLGLDPRDGFVIQAAGTPTVSTAQTVSVLGASRWRPGGAIEVFSSAVLDMSTTTDTYYIFDTSTGNIWTEINKTCDLTWTLRLVAGLVVPVTDSMIVGFTLSGTGSSGSASGTTDALPTSGGTPTTTFSGPTPYLDDSNSGAFTLNVSGVIGL